MSIRSRKTDHIFISLRRNVTSQVKTGFADVRFLHRGLPEISLADVDTRCQIWGKTLSLPLLISSMTGGTHRAGKINKRLAIAAQKTGVGLALGSMRIALEIPELAKTFDIRSVAPDILLLANIGAVQLNKGYSLEHCRRLVDMVAADGLILHLNPLHEALQLDGDTDFHLLLRKIELICRGLDVPVIAKEVGWGISAEVARKLVNAGVQAIDVAGAGGTSWSQVEMHRLKRKSDRRVAAAFNDWGIPTVESLRMVKNSLPNTVIIASGGLATGIDIAKSIAMGASMGAMARPFLRPATKSTERISDEIRIIEKQLRIAMFAAGIGNIKQLSKAPLFDKNGHAL
jgi:isopentenyl-diphosphate delta-isomerase